MDSRKESNVSLYFRATLGVDTSLPPGGLSQIASYYFHSALLLTRTLCALVKSDAKGIGFHWDAALVPLLKALLMVCSLFTNHLNH